MSPLNERTASLAARMGEVRPRSLVPVALTMTDGTLVRGMLHRAQGTRTLDYLNHQAETFVAITDATLERGGDVEEVAFIAINKSHITRVIEAADVD